MKMKAKISATVQIPGQPGLRQEAQVRGVHRPVQNQVAKTGTGRNLSPTELGNCGYFKFVYIESATFCTFY